MKDLVDPKSHGWNWKEDVSPQNQCHMLECVMEIAQALQGLTSLPQSQVNKEFYVKQPQIVSAARRTSVQIRKLMLDGNGWLLKQCVTDANFHDLTLRYKYPPVDFVQHNKELYATLTFEDGTQSTVLLPAHNHTITIHPVVGLRHIDKAIFGVHSPFNYDADPIKFQKWMNIQVIEIDRHKFKTEQLLRIMSNMEGAHIKDNPGLTIPDGLDFDVDKNRLHQLFNGVKFGGLTYLQIFTLFTGLYVVNRVKMMLEQMPLSKNNESINYICETISNSPQQITSENLEMSSSSYLMVVLGNDRKPRGDYSKGTRFYIKTPRNS